MTTTNDLRTGVRVPASTAIAEGCWPVAVVLCALTLVGVAGCSRSDPVELLVVDETLKRDAQGEVLRPLRIGERIVVRGGSVLDRGRNELWFFENDDVVRKGPALIPLPATTERRFAQPLGAVLARYDPSTKRYEGVRRLKAREPVDVVPHPTAKRLVCLHDGAVEGTVDARAVERVPATVPRMFARARNLLIAGELDEARWFAEQVVGIDPTHRSAARMLAAIRIEEGDTDGWRAWAKVRPPALPTIAPTRKPVAGRPAFVMASKLTLRDGPEKQAKARALLPIGSEVQVLELRGRWARVAVLDVLLRSDVALQLGPFGSLPTSPVLHLDELARHGPSAHAPRRDARAPKAAPPPSDAGTGAADGGVRSPGAGAAPVNREGWLSASFLDRTKPDAEQLRAVATAAQERGDHDLAIVALERLFAAQRDTVWLSTAAKEAVAAERWRRFFVLTKERDHASAAATRAPFEIAVDRYAACRGDPFERDLIDVDERRLPASPSEVAQTLRERAAVVARGERGGGDDDGDGGTDDADAPLPAWPKSVCVSRLIDQPVCEAFVISPEVGGELEGLSEAEQQVVQDEYVREQAAAEARNDAVQAAAEDRRAAFDALVHRQLGDHAEPAFVIRLDNLTEAPATPDAFMVVYTGTRVTSGYCGNVETEGITGVTSRVFKAPTVAPQSRLELWFEGDAHTVGVAFVSSEDAARWFIANALRTRDAAIIEPGDPPVGGPKTGSAAAPLVTEVHDPIDDCSVDACGC